MRYAEQHPLEYYKIYVKKYYKNKHLYILDHIFFYLKDILCAKNIKNNIECIKFHITMYFLILSLDKRKTMNKITITQHDFDNLIVFAYRYTETRKSAGLWVVSEILKKYKLDKNIREKILDEVRSTLRVWADDKGSVDYDRLLEIEKYLEEVRHENM